MNFSREYSAYRPLRVVVATVVVALLTACVPGTEASVSPRPSSIVSSWEDGKGFRVILREGVYYKDTKVGLGWKKINEKHGIHSQQTVKFPTLNPDGPQIQGARHKYTAYAAKLEHTQVVEEIPVLTIVETRWFESYYGVTINGSPGVLTSYCRNKNREEKCPNWIDAAFDGAKKTLPDGKTKTTEPDEHGVEYRLSYTPLADGG